MTAPRQPRVFHAGDKIPPWGYTQLRTVNGQIWQRRVDRDPMSLWWGSDNGDGTFGPDRLIEDVLAYFGTLSEVLPETPEPPKVIDWDKIAKACRRFLDAHGDPIADATVLGSVGNDLRIHLNRGLLPSQSSPTPLLPLSAPVETEGQVEGRTEALRAFEQDLRDIIHDRTLCLLDSDQDALTAAVMEHIRQAGWRPPLAVALVPGDRVDVVEGFSHRQGTVQHLGNLAGPLVVALEPLPADEVEWGRQWSANAGGAFVDALSKDRKTTEDAVRPGTQLVSRTCTPWVAVPVEPKETNHG